MIHPVPDPAWVHPDGKAKAWTAHLGDDPNFTVYLWLAERPDGEIISGWGSYAHTYALQYATEKAMGLR